ncbi:hypothetical protein RRF57_007084 [Xylaria bambusicola]|uniref:Uncharacterized protein n=1 Tax=Xylaria bambusicola TaxID=326684 RepID=A0AAN7YZH6_9PEZI
MDSSSDQPVILRVDETEAFTFPGADFNSVGFGFDPNEPMSDSMEPLRVPSHTNVATQTQAAPFASSTASAMPDLSEDCDMHDGQSGGKPSNKMKNTPISLTFCRIAHGTNSFNQMNATSSTMYAEPPSSTVMRGLALVGVVGVSWLVWFTKIKPSTD